MSPSRYSIPLSSFVKRDNSAWWVIQQCEKGDDNAGWVFQHFWSWCWVVQSNRNRTVLRLKREIHFRRASVFDEKTESHQFAHRNKNSFSSFPDYFSTPSTQHAATSFSIEYYYEKKGNKSVKRSSKLQLKQTSTKMTAFVNCLHTSVSVHFGCHATHSRQLKGGCVRTCYEWFCPANLYVEISHNSKEQFYCMQGELLMNNTLRNAKLVYTDREWSLRTWHWARQVPVCHR